MTDFADLEAPEAQFPDLVVRVEHGWRFRCRYDGDHYALCPSNDHGLCRTVYLLFPWNLLHEWDGKNIIKCLCG